MIMDKKAMLKRLQHMELSIGRGRNYFTMSRGSFRYLNTLYLRRPLRFSGLRQNETGMNLIFRDDRADREYTLAVTADDHGFDIALTGDTEEYNRFWISLPCGKNEHFYGTGETYSEFDLKGQKARIFVAEHQNTSRITRKLVREMVSGVDPERKLPFGAYESYYVQPTFVSSECWYFHADTDRYAEFDFRRDRRIVLQFQEVPVFHIGIADDFETLTQQMHTLLGDSEKLPEWVYDGAILAIQEGCGAVENRVQKALDAGAKICGVWSQDWCGCRRTGFGYQVMWNWEYDRELYPDLPAKIQQWKEKGIRFLGYINPFLALEKDLYAYAAEKGYCVKDRRGRDYLVTITTFPAAMIDFTNPAAYAWYKDLIKKNMIGIGMSGWMADFGEYLPTDCILYSGEPAEKMHNRWPAIWAKMNREAIEECGVQNEVFFFTRAGYTGSVGNTPMMWTGDQHVDWSVDDGLPSVIPATLSLAMSGQPLTHSDVGGYTTIMNMTRSKELLMRWEEMNVFSPLYRFHEGNQPSRNVQFDADEELLAHLAKMSGMHTILKPYLMKLEEQAHTGIPVMRPLFMYYSHYDNEYSMYMLGRDLLIAPVLEAGAVRRTVRLPEDHWIELHTMKEYSGGTVTVDAPVGTIPVFMRRDAADLKKETAEALHKEMKK